MPRLLKTALLILEFRFNQFRSWIGKSILGKLYDDLEHNLRIANEMIDKDMRTINNLRIREGGCQDALAGIDRRSRAASGHVDAVILGEAVYRGGTVRSEALAYEQVRFPKAGLTLKAEGNEISVSRDGAEELYRLVPSGLRFPPVYVRDGVDPRGGRTITLP